MHALVQAIIAHIALRDRECIGRNIDRINLNIDLSMGKHIRRHNRQATRPRAQF